MNFTSFGMWVAHGEGKLVFDSEDKNKFIPILKYTDCFLNIDDSDDDDLNVDLSYPQNPNGSTNNTTGIISIDGRISWFNATF